MRIGVFTVLFQKLPVEAALDKIAAAGIAAVEIGVGGYRGSHHCRVDELLEDEDRRKAYLTALHSRGLLLSGLNSSDPLHPDKKLAPPPTRRCRRRPAGPTLEVPVVIALSSGYPPACRETRHPTG